jgi:excinuclease ABC subunit C
LNAALKVFKQKHQHQPIILSIVKGANRVRATETILSEQGILEIPINSPGFNLLQQIRDESHRFAITSNRKKKINIDCRAIWTGPNFICYCKFI